MGKLTQDIKYLNMSDIHLGRKNNHIDNISTNIYSYFKKYKRTLSSLDILIIAGDTYDRSLRHGSYEAIKATEVLTFIAEFCLEFNIIFIVLEGTPSHDWKQVQAFAKSIETNKSFKDLDFRYITDLSIEHIEKFGIDILFIPDEWSDSPETTLLEVHKLLHKRNLKQVDITIMHGHFDYQLPKMILGGHSEEDYLKITKGYIHIGHVHTFSTYDRIIANGSFDRLAFGEEEDKGAVIVNEFCSGTRNFIFLPNINAVVFDTYVIDDMELIEIKKLLRNKYGINNRVNIRLRSVHDTVNNIMRDLSTSFININFTPDKITPKTIKGTEELFKQVDTVTEITPSNIERLILERIDSVDSIMLEELKLVI